jgi:hypothetical protein
MRPGGRSLRAVLDRVGARRGRDGGGLPGDLRGELWRVGADGRKERVLEGIPLSIRPQSELIGLSRFDVRPDGSRIVIEAFDAFEADISMIENVP